MNGTMTRLFQAFPLEKKDLRMLQVLEQCRSELLKRKESIERRVRELLDTHGGCGLVILSRNNGYR